MTENTQNAPVAEKKEVKFDNFSKASVSKQETSTTAAQERPRRDFRRKGGRNGRRPEKVKSEFDQKTLNIRRVTRVSAGGRRFNFSVAIVVGNRRGKVGVGTGKASDTTLAIDKAVRDAKKNLIQVKTIKGFTIPHEVSCKYSSARVMIKPAPGRGIIAGSAVADVLQLAGVRDVNAKVLSKSKNKLNIAQATVKALSLLKNPKKEDLPVKPVRSESVSKDEKSKVAEKTVKLTTEK